MTKHSSVGFRNSFSIVSRARTLCKLLPVLLTMETWRDLDSCWPKTRPSIYFYLNLFFRLEHVRSVWLACLCMVGEEEKQLWRVTLCRDDSAVVSNPSRTLNPTSDLYRNPLPGQSDTLCSFMLIYVCLTWITINNGRCNRANLIGFAALSPVISLAWESKLHTQSQRSAGAALLHLDSWMNQWVNSQLGVACLTWITLLHENW